MRKYCGLKRATARQKPVKAEKKRDNKMMLKTNDDDDGGDDDDDDEDEEAPLTKKKRKTRQNKKKTKHKQATWKLDVGQIFFSCGFQSTPAKKW